MVPVNLSVLYLKRVGHYLFGVTGIRAEERTTNKRNKIEMICIRTMMYVRSIAIDKCDDDGDDRGLAKNMGVNGIINALVDDGAVKPTNVRTIVKIKYTDPIQQKSYGKTKKTSVR
jgi:hypothetical protein